MITSVRISGLLAALLLFPVAPVAPQSTDDYSETVEVFKNAIESGSFFDNAYGYAVFPTIGKAGFIIGGAYGEGRVFEQGRHVGKSSVAQLSAGLLAGGKAYSQIVFFEDQRAFREFTSGSFEFGGEISAVAITASAGAQATSTGSSAGASGGKNDASTMGTYRKGMAVFTVTKGGAMGELSLSGLKFSYTPRG
jgi:lipid-binding SYLF domain-containing protein